MMFPFDILPESTQHPDIHMDESHIHMMNRDESLSRHLNQKVSLDPDQSKIRIFLVRTSASSLFRFSFDFHATHTLDAGICRLEIAWESLRRSKHFQNLLNEKLLSALPWKLKEVPSWLNYHLIFSLFSSILLSVNRRYSPSFPHSSHTAVPNLDRRWYPDLLLLRDRSWYHDCAWLVQQIQQ